MNCLYHRYSIVNSIKLRLAALFLVKCLLLLFFFTIYYYALTNVNSIIAYKLELQYY